MIVFDAGEREGLSLTAIDALHAETLPWLEQLTGADALVSPIGVPLTPATLPIHLANRAILVQIKHGEDLLASAGYRANESLARMLAVTGAPWQRLLLAVGHFARGAEDVCLIGTERPVSDANKPFITWWKGRGSYTVYQSILRRWSLRGGTVGSCPTADLLPSWLRSLESDFSLLDPVKEFWQPVELDELKLTGPLQELVPVRDWRRLLSAFPGVGPSKIDALVEAFREKNLNLTGALALEWALEHPDVASLKVPGWGKKTRLNLRQWLGLGDNETFWIARLDSDFLRNVNAAIEEAKALDGYVEPPESD